MKFSYRQEFATEPIAEALRRRGWQTIPSDRPEEALLDASADIVMAPALEYGRSLGPVDYALVPGFGITTRGFAGLLKLVFNKGLVSFSSLAVKRADAAEALVARMILVEKHDIEPAIVSVAEDAALEEMLAVADAALLAGEDAVFRAGSSTSLLDLTDEWEDAMETPLPYMLAWGRVGMVPQSAIDELQSARDEAVLMFADRAAQHPMSSQANTFYQHYLRGAISYTFGEAELAAVDSFFRYAFYHSIITDIPTIKLLPDGEPAITPSRPQSDASKGNEGSDQSKQQ